jgi:hypothetical protein
MSKGAFAFLALLGFAPVGWFGWKWLRDRPTLAGWAYWRDCFFSGHGVDLMRFLQRYIGLGVA